MLGKPGIFLLGSVVGSSGLRYYSELMEAVDVSLLSVGEILSGAEALRAFRTPSEEKKENSAVKRKAEKSFKITKHARLTVQDRLREYSVDDTPIEIRVHRGRSGRMVQMPCCQLFKPLRLTTDRKHVHCDTCNLISLKKHWIRHAEGIDHATKVLKANCALSSRDELLHVVSAFRAKHKDDVRKELPPVFYGSRVTDEELMLRVDATLATCSEGLSLSSFAVFDNLVARSKGSPLLGHSRSCIDECIPIGFAMHKEKKMQSLSSRNLGVCFDGSGRGDDRTMGISVSYIDDARDWKLIVEPLVFRITVFKMTGDACAELITDTLASFAISPQQVLSFISDGCATNRATITACGVAYRNAFDNICVSHRLDRSIEYLEGAVWKEFWTSYATLFSKSNDYRLLVHEILGIRAASYSTVRWLSKLQPLQQGFELLITDQFQFIDSLGTLKSTSWQNIMDMINDKRKCLRLKAELASMLDMGFEVIKLVYKFEGDKPLVFECHKVLTAIKAWSNGRITRTFMDKLLLTLSNDEKNSIADVNQLVQGPLINYLVQCYSLYEVEPEKRVKSIDTLGNMKLLYLYAELFNPDIVNSFSGKDTFIQEFQNRQNLLMRTTHWKGLPYDIANMIIIELPKYFSKTVHLAGEYDCEKTLKYWGSKQVEFPGLSSIAKKLAIILVSSASVERMFSYLKGRYGVETFTNIKSDRINLGLWQSTSPLVPERSYEVIELENDLNDTVNASFNVEASSSMLVDEESLTI